MRPGGYSTKKLSCVLLRYRYYIITYLPGADWWYKITSIQCCTWFVASIQPILQRMGPQSPSVHHAHKQALFTYVANPCSLVSLSVCASLRLPGSELKVLPRINTVFMHNSSTSQTIIQRRNTRTKTFAKHLQFVTVHFLFMGFV
jgi:hypothetical protein